MNKNINETAENVDFSKYPNVKFSDNVVKGSKPTKDKINPSLLLDVQKAAKIAGVTPQITTAVSGHKNSGRHPYGNAVDIAMINGKAVSSSNRGDADKLVNALISMGYTKNTESGNDKAVLTFGFPGHDNHVHVSRNSGGSESPVNQNMYDELSKQQNTTPMDDSTSDESTIQSDLVSALSGTIKQMYPGLNEELERIKKIMK